jgi:hypothetical protein
MANEQIDSKPEEVKEEEKKPEETPGEKKETEKKETLNDLLGGEQSANKIHKGSAEKKPEAEKPKAGSESPEEKKPEDNPDDADKKKAEEGKGLFWGKFKDEETAKSSYDEAQKKITTQGQEMSELRSTKEEADNLLITLNEVLESNPEIAEAIKTAIAKKNPEKKPEAKEDINVEETVEKVLQKKEAAEQQKKSFDKWFEDHPDVKEEDGKLGHAILDEIEKENYPLTVKSLQTIYDAMTRGSAIDKAKKDALKELAEGDLEEGTKVAKDGSSHGKKPKEGTSLNDLLGGGGNANRIGK